MPDPMAFWLDRRLPRSLRGPVARARAGCPRATASVSGAPLVLSFIISPHCFIAPNSEIDKEKGGSLELQDFPLGILVPRTGQTINAGSFFSDPVYSSTGRMDREKSRFVRQRD